MRGRSGDKARLQHILDAILEVEDYLVETDFKKFMENSMMRFACIKQLEIIGEAEIIFQKKQRQNSQISNGHRLSG